MARFWSGRGPSGCLEHLSRWVAAGTGLAAIVAALVSYLTLSELKEQTINAFRPELIMQGSSFRLYRTPDVNDGISTPAFFSTEAIPSTGRSTAREHSLSVTLSNVGLGAALNIQVEWEYDRKHYLERIKAMESVYCIHVVFPEAAEGGMDYILEDCKSGQAVLGYATHSTDSIDFILPHGADVEPTEARPPIRTHGPEPSVQVASAPPSLALPDLLGRPGVVPHHLGGQIQRHHLVRVGRQEPPPGGDRGGPAVLDSKLEPLLQGDPALPYGVADGRGNSHLSLRA